VLSAAALSLAIARASIGQTSSAQDISVAAVTGEKGGQDLFGAYEVVADWPRELAGALPDHQGWTYGASQSIFAESPDRIFVLQRGELPIVARPAERRVGPSLTFPIGRLPVRDTTVASMPTNGATNVVVADAVKTWHDRGYQTGVDARWEHCLFVLNRRGEIVESWTQWDSLFQLPHFVAISPFDAEKHVWVVDDHKHVIHKFTNDGKTKVMTLGTYGVAGSDAAHFNRPTFIDWFPDGSFVVADGYYGTRVVKFDKDGRFLMAWGEKSASRNDVTPAHFNNVHGIAIDQTTRRVFVNDRANQRVQVFDENGRYLDQWRTGTAASDIHVIHVLGRALWAADRGTNKILKWDLDGRFQYAWGTFGDFPGGMWGVHGMSVDQEGSFYVAEVGNGGVQKYRPRPGANPPFLVGQPHRSAWR
jgi:DNA-binding beta-propeller fold protein YncE